MLTAKHLVGLMSHKDSPSFCVVSRANHLIQAAALRGEAGILFSYPKKYDGTQEVEVFYQDLERSGYWVNDVEGRDPELHYIEIWWAA